VNTKSTQGDSPLSRFVQIDSPLDKLSWEYCLIFPKFEGYLMVIFITINSIVMVDYSNDEQKGMKTNPIILELTLTIMVKQEGEDSKP